MEKCQKCGEELNEGWDVCWKCSHNHNKEKIIPKESLIKTDLDSNKKIDYRKDLESFKFFLDLLKVLLILMFLVFLGVNYNYIDSLSLIIFLFIVLIQFYVFNRMKQMIDYMFDIDERKKEK